jgi:modulator of FtsH protease HflC
MSHGHHHHGHHHHGHHNHGDDDQSGLGPVGRQQGVLGRYGRFVIAFVIISAAVISACIVLVGPGRAVIVTRFGDPIRVLTARPCLENAGTVRKHH